MATGIVSDDRHVIVLDKVVAVVKCNTTQLLVFTSCHSAPMTFMFTSEAARDELFSAIVAALA